MLEANSFSLLERNTIESRNQSYNHALEASGRKANPNLGKDDFLKLLIVQLSHQDPLNPQDHSEFAAQMAQFSSVEQLTNLSRGFETLSGTLGNSNLIGLIGKRVEVNNGEGSVVSGMVEKIKMEKGQALMEINGQYYEASAIKNISMGADL